MHLSTFSTDSSCQLNVLWHDGDSLGVDGAQVRVFKERDEVGFSGFLEGSNGRALESQIGLVVLSNFSHQSLEREFANQKFSGLLVSSDFSQGDCSRSESV